MVLGEGIVRAEEGRDDTAGESRLKESVFWSRLRRALPREGHYSRVENPTDPGTPDVSFCIPHAVFQPVEGWMELKYKARAPLGKKGLRPAQKLWIERRLKAGGLVLIAVGIGKRIFFIHGNQARRVNRWKLEDFETLSRTYCSRLEPHQVAWAFSTAISDFRRQKPSTSRPNCLIPKQLYS